MSRSFSSNGRRVSRGRAIAERGANVPLWSFSDAGRDAIDDEELLTGGGGGYAVECKRDEQRRASAGIK
jgi:hypothetical protein